MNAAVLRAFQNLVAHEVNSHWTVIAYSYANGFPKLAKSGEIALKNYNKVIVTITKINVKIIIVPYLSFKAENGEKFQFSCAIFCIHHYIFKLIHYAYYFNLYRLNLLENIFEK